MKEIGRELTRIFFVFPLENHHHLQINYLIQNHVFIKSLCRSELFSEISLHPVESKMSMCKKVVEIIKGSSRNWDIWCLSPIKWCTKTEIVIEISTEHIDLEWIRCFIQHSLCFRWINSDLILIVVFMISRFLYLFNYKNTDEHWHKRNWLDRIEDYNWDNHKASGYTADRTLNWRKLKNTDETRHRHEHETRHTDTNRPTDTIFIQLLPYEKSSILVSLRLICRAEAELEIHFGQLTGCSQLESEIQRRSLMDGSIHQMTIIVMVASKGDSTVFACTRQASVHNFNLMLLMGHRHSLSDHTRGGTSRGSRWGGSSIGPGGVSTSQSRGSGSWTTDCSVSVARPERGATEGSRRFRCRSSGWFPSRGWSGGGSPWGLLHERSERNEKEMVWDGATKAGAYVLI